MGFIYKITNDINSKVYIGKTEVSVEKRWKQHLNDYKRECYADRAIYKAMKKYGIKHFSIEEIDTADDPIKLANLECHYIALYDSFKNGYNCTLGGFGVAWVNEKLVLDSYAKNKSLIAVYKETGITQKTIRKILHKHNVEIVKQKDVMTSTYGIKVNMCCKETGEIVNTFSSTMEAFRFLSDNNLTTTKESGVRAHIKDCLVGKRKSAFGYTWSFA